MNQSSEARAAQLEQRSKELDAREAYIEAREDIRKRTDEQIAENNRQISLQDKRLEERGKLERDQQARIAALELAYAKKGASLEAEIFAKEERYGDWQVKIQKAKEELRSVKDSIAERKRYYDEQEALIAKQAEEGNLQLRGLEYEIIESRQVIKDLEVKRTNLFSEQKTLNEDIERARNDFALEIEQHEEHMRQLQAQEIDVRDRITAGKSELHDLNKENNATLVKRQQIHDGDG